MRELKQVRAVPDALALRRTPPGVRELKQAIWLTTLQALSRTPPGVRELKQAECRIIATDARVAPLPGCVN